MNMGNTFKRILAMVLALTMVLAYVPFNTFATEGENELVAELNGNQYESLQAAVDDAKTGDTVVLLDNITLTDDDMTQAADGKNVMIHVTGKSITLDLNEKTITVDYNGGQYLYAAVLVADGASLTVTGNGGIDIRDNGENVAYMFWKRGTTGTLVVENGTYHMDNSADSMVYTNGNEIVTIKGGTWTLDAWNYENGPWIFNVQGAGDNHVIVTGGTFNSNVQRQKWANEVMVPVTHYVEANADGAWTVKEGATLYAIEDILTGPYFIEDWSIGYSDLEAFVAAANAAADDTTDLYDPIVIYNDDVSTYKAKGYKLVANDDGATYSVVEYAEPVAKIGDVEYSSIQAAVEAAKPGDTITVIADHEMDCGNPVTNSDGFSALVNVAGKAVTIDLNGKTITVSPKDEQFTNAVGSMLMSVFAVDTDGTLTLKDSVGTGKVAVTANDANVYSLAVCYGEGGKLNIESGSYTADEVSSALIYSQHDEVVTITGGNFHLGNVGTGSNGSPWIFNAKDQNTQNIIVLGGTYNADIFHQYYIFEVKDTTEVAELLGVPVKAAKDNGDGTWTVVDAVAYVDEQHKSGNWYTQYTGYATLEEAIAASGKYANAGLGYTVTLVSNAEVTGNAVLKEGTTLVCGDYSVVLAAADATLTAPEDLNVTTNVANGKVVCENGTHKVVVSTPVAEVNGTQYESLTEAVAAANAVEGGATVTLLKDVTLGEKLTISGNVTISGAYTITRDAAYTGTLFEVASGATLTLDGGLVVDGGNAWVYTKTPLEMDMANGNGTKVADHITPAEGGVNATAHLIVNNGTLNANKVTIQNSYSTNGVSVINCGASSVTTLDGATIRNTAANRSGAVVYVGGADAVLTIKGDTRITGNFGIGNGGIIQNYGQGTTVNLEGGSIDNNHVGNSGTVYASYSSNANKINTFNMSGGIITQNIMEGYGPVYIHTNTVWNMTGGEISENTSYLPSYVRNNNPAGTMSGGKIVNNEITCGDYSSGYYVTHPDLRLNGKTPITGGTFTQDVFEYLAPNTGLAYDEATGTYTVTDHVYNLYFRDPVTGEQLDYVGPLQGNDAASLVATGKLFYADYYVMELEVLSNVKIDETIVIDYPMTVNLNGHTITTVATEAGNYMDAFTILADVTVTGEGKINARPSHGYTFYVGDKNGNAGNLTIENGTFYGETSVVNNRLGTVTINGGNFAISLENEGDTYDFVLNCIDANYNAGTAKIVVKGGTFYKFNPADNEAEIGDHTNFVAEGYISEELTEGYFTVREANYVAQVGETKYTSLQAAINACTNGETVKLIDDIVYDADDVVNAIGGATGFGDYPNPAIIYVGGTRVDGVNSPSNVNAVLDLNGHTITNNADAYLFLFMDNCKIKFVDSQNGNGIIGNTAAPIIWVTGTDTLVTIESGKYTTVNAEGLIWATHSGDLVIKGGEFSTTADDASLLIIRNSQDRKNSAYFISGKSTVTVSGGTFKGFNPEKMQDDSTTPFTEFNAVAEGYKAEDNGDGTWSVVPNMIFEMHLVDANGEAHWLSPMRSNDLNDVIEKSKIWYDSLQGTYSFTLKVLESYELDETVLATFPMTIDLCGNTLTVAETMNATPAIRVLSDVTVTNGTVDATAGTSTYAFIVGNSTTDGTLTIVDGTYKGRVSVASVTKGTLTIEGGNFEATEYEGAHEFTLNCIDANYTAGTAKIVVKGGTFVGFNPENNAAEGAGTNFVAEGYAAIYDEAQNTYTVVDYIKWIKAELLAGNDVTLDRDITVGYEYVDSVDCTANGNGQFKNWGIFTVISGDVTFDLNGHNVTFEGHSDEFCNKVAFALFYANNGGKLTVTGEGNVTVNGMATGAYSTCVGSELTIEGGNWVNNPCTECDAWNIFLYASHGGALYIKGGSFAQNVEDNYLIVEHTGYVSNNDALVDYSKTVVEITGGSFKGMNPEEARSCNQKTWSSQEWGTTNVVAKGYKAEDNGDGTWSVVPNMIFKLHIIDPNTNEPATIPYIEGNDLAKVVADGKLFYANYYNMVLEILGDWELDEGVVIDYPMTIDLGGNTLTTTDDVNPAIRVLADVTVKNGKMNTAGYCFIVGNGDGVSGNLTIESGSYTGLTSVASVTKGTLTITGGTFETAEGDYGATYLLNCIDANVKDGTAKIVVKGGTFVGFNPEDNAAENPKVNFCAEGYEAVDNGNDTWTVMHEPIAIVTFDRYVGGKPMVNAAKAEVLIRDPAQFTGEWFQTIIDAQIAPFTVENFTVTLCADVELTGYLNITIADEITLDLNGYKITREGTGIYVNNADTVLTIKDSSEAKTGKISATQAVWAAAGKVVIESGSFHGTGDTIYTSGSGAIEIKGGTFSAEETDHTNNKYCVLNQKDSDRETSSITVYGGTFVGFNPENNASEGANTNFVAEGYKAVDNGNDTWTVQEKKLFDISFARMTLANALDMSFAFEAGHADDWTGAYVEIVKSYADGTTQTQTVNQVDWGKTTIEGVRHYYVTFKGIAAKEMADTVKVTVYNANGEAISHVWEDSVRAYAMRTLNNPDSTAEELTMIVDMLNYGAAAQSFFEYNEEDLANCLLSDAQKNLATKTTAYEDTRVKGDNFLGSNLNLVSSIEMMVAFKNIDQSMRAVISYVDHYGNTKKIDVAGSEFELNNGAYVIYVNSTVVADARQDVTVTVYNGETAVASATDSVESYVARAMASEDSDPLFEMIMKFADSAYVYLHKQ